MSKTIAQIKSDCQKYYTILKLRNLVWRRHMAQAETIFGRAHDVLQTCKQVATGKSGLQTRFGTVQDLCVPLTKHGEPTPWQKRYEHILSLCISKQEQDELIRDREALDYYSTVASKC